MCHLQASQIQQGKNAPVTYFDLIIILYSKRHFVKEYDTQDFS